ncbi:MAG: LysE family transporter [Bacteroidales bacterium]|jgi:threonine/homoserine/homoserine lactone efflux protein|nr:LysE family transporter [Bacteroidales bacterium]MDD4671805.1 LysE family transporter [Bacteroidales bacterium]MDY0347335.1 LysE family transporter [Tenuifilaceae bacterium]
MLLTLFIKGILVGLLASIPLGPIGIICIQRTVNKGKLSGFLSGIGAASADTIFATIAGFSLTFIISYIEEKQIVFQAIGGLIILLLGIKIFYTNPIKQLRRHKRKKNNLLEDYVSVLLLTITNPLAIFLFIALFASLGIVSDEMGIAAPLVTVSGVFIGAIIWWYTLTTLVSIYRSKFRLKQLWWINKISGALIFTLGSAALLGIIRLFIK